MRGPYVLTQKDGKVAINIQIPVQLHDDLMRILVATENNPNRSEWIRDAIKLKMDSTAWWKEHGAHKTA